jgi:flagellar hook assembly protein FlgD
VQTLPLVFAVEQNYPNPFNPSTNIKYAIPHDEHVVIEVYNMAGQKVRTVVNQMQKAGHYTVLWHSDNDAGQRVGSGVYFYRVTAGENSVVKKMLLVK